MAASGSQLTSVSKVPSLSDTFSILEQADNFLSPAAGAAHHQHCAAETAVMEEKLGISLQTTLAESQIRAQLQDEFDRKLQSELVQVRIKHQQELKTAEESYQKTITIQSILIKALLQNAVQLETELKQQNEKAQNDINNAGAAIAKLLLAIPDFIAMHVATSPAPAIVSTQNVVYSNTTVYQYNHLLTLLVLNTLNNSAPQALNLTTQATLPRVASAAASSELATGVAPAPAAAVHNNPAALFHASRRKKRPHVANGAPVGDLTAGAASQKTSAKRSRTS